VAYSTVADIRRILKSQSGSITISPQAASYGSPGSMFTLNQCGSFIADADAEIDGRCYRYYADQIPFLNIPPEIKQISGVLASAFILQAASQYTASETSDYLFDKQLLLLQQATDKLNRLASGKDFLVGRSLSSPVWHGVVSDESEIFDGREHGGFREM